jgi:hypothetical protein
MPSATQLEAATHQFLDEFKANYASGSWDWFWKLVSNPDEFSYCDVSGAVFWGRKEVQPVIETWSGLFVTRFEKIHYCADSLLSAGRYGKIETEVVGPITALPSLFGPISLVHYQEKWVLEKMPAPEIPNVTTRDTFVLFDAGCKVVRVRDESLDSFLGKSSRSNSRRCSTNNSQPTKTLVSLRPRSKSTAGRCMGGPTAGFRKPNLDLRRWRKNSSLLAETSRRSRQLVPTTVTPAILGDLDELRG